MPSLEPQKPHFGLSNKARRKGIYGLMMVALGTSKAQFYLCSDQAMQWECRAHAACTSGPGSGYQWGEGERMGFVRFVRICTCGPRFHRQFSLMPFAVCRLPMLICCFQAACRAPSRQPSPAQPIISHWAWHDSHMICLSRLPGSCPVLSCRLTRLLGRPDGHEDEGRGRRRMNRIVSIQGPARV